MQSSSRPQTGFRRHSYNHMNIAATFRERWTGLCPIRTDLHCPIKRGLQPRRTTFLLYMSPWHYHCASSVPAHLVTVYSRHTVIFLNPTKTCEYKLACVQLPNKTHIFQSANSIQWGFTQGGWSQKSTIASFSHLLPSPALVCNRWIGEMTLLSHFAHRAFTYPGISDQCRWRRNAKGTRKGDYFWLLKCSHHQGLLLQTALL